jgi:uncharacterized protein (TIGR02001 family)
MKEKGSVMQNSTKSRLLLAVLGALLALPVLADENASPTTANVSMTGNYVYRGISRSGGKPAIQGGFDYAVENGFYIGAWSSSASWVSDKSLATNASLELDAYTGIKNSFATDYTYDIGFLRYTFPGTYTPAVTRPDTNELYGALAYKWASVKYSYSMSNTFGVIQARGSNYLDVSLNYPVPDSTFTLIAHYGKQNYLGPNAGTGIGTLSYKDYKLGFNKDMGGFVLGVAYTRTNTDKGAGSAYNVQGNDLGRGTTVLSLSRTF